MQCILDAGLLLLQLDLGRRANLDDGYAATELGQALLQLLFVVVAGGLVDLNLDLRDAALDVVRLAAALDDRRVVLGRDDAPRLAELSQCGLVDFLAQLFGDHRAAGERRDVAQHVLAAIAEARRLDREHVEDAAQLVDHQGRQGLAVDVLGDDDQLFATRLNQLFEDRDDVGDGTDLLVGDEDVRLVDRRFHPRGVGDEVRRDVAAVELHALGVFDLELEALALFDGDDAVAADLVHGLGQQSADLGIVGRNGGDVLDVGVALQRGRELFDLGDHGLGCGVDAALHQHRVGPGGQVAQAFGDDRLGQDRGGRSAVAGHVVGLGSSLLEHLRAHVLEVVLELDLFGHGHTVVGDGGRAPLLVDGHVAAARAEGDLDRVGEGVDTRLELSTRLGIENEIFSGHVFSLLLLRGLFTVGDDREQVGFADDEVVLAVELDFGAGVLGKQHFVAGLDVHFDALAVIEHAA